MTGRSGPLLSIVGVVVIVAGVALGVWGSPDPGRWLRVPGPWAGQAQAWVMAGSMRTAPSAKQVA